MVLGLDWTRRGAVEREVPASRTMELMLGFYGGLGEAVAAKLLLFLAREERSPWRKLRAEKGGETS